MDAAGFSDVPILTTDVGDSKDMHHGVSFIGPHAVWEAVWCFMMLDILQSLVRKIRPYERNKGETDGLFHNSICEIAEAIKHGTGAAKKAFKKSIEDFTELGWDRSRSRSKVLVTGELLVTYHPGSNYNMERYLEKCGMEVVFPRITDQLRKDFYGQMHQIKDFKAGIPPYPFLVDGIFDHVQKNLENIAVMHPLYEREARPKDIYEGVSDFMPVTLSCGEGWLMAAEIDHMARDGVRSFVILQPFGCLPNHVCGRGIIRKLKERYPDIYILPLDLDPDTSMANIENRLQMLIMGSEEM